MAQFQRFITVGDGENARRVPIQDSTPAEPLQLFSVPSDNLNDPYSDLVDTLGQMYNHTNDDIENQLRVKELIESFRESFKDDLAFHELKSHVEHVYHRLVNLQQHIRNLNQVATTKGISLRHLEGQLTSLQKQAVQVFSYLEKLPQRSTEEGIEASNLEKNVIDSLNIMLSDVSRLRHHDYNKKKGKTSRGWDHLNKAALNNYVKESTPEPVEAQNTSMPIMQQDGVQDVQYGSPLDTDEEGA